MSSSKKPTSKTPLVLSVLARAPEFGCVKSRLARHVGRAQALRTHIELLRHNLLVALSTGYAVELVVAGDSQHPWLLNLAQRLGIPLLPQSEGDIGARMLATAQRVTLAGQASIIIGSDCAVMNKAYLHKAAKYLRDSTKIVYGPAEDGGYVLVAQREAIAAAFEGIHWGSQHVLRESRAALRDAQIEFAELETLWDVDTIADLRRMQRELHVERSPQGNIFVPS